MNRRGADRTGPLGGAGIIGLWGASSLIKSVQRGTVTVADNANSGTATITSVSLPDSILFYNQYYTNMDAFGAWTNYNWKWSPAVNLTNATTVTGYMNGSSGAGQTQTLAFEVIEFMSGVLRSVQRIALTCAYPNATATSTITSVNTAKAVFISSGLHAYTTQADNPTGLSMTTALTNSTTVTATIPGASSAYRSHTVYGAVVEFF